MEVILKGIQLPLCPPTTSAFWHQVTQPLSHLWLLVTHTHQVMMIFNHIPLKCVPSFFVLSAFVETLVTSHLVFLSPVFYVQFNSCYQPGPEWPYNAYPGTSRSCSEICNDVHSKIHSPLVLSWVCALQLQLTWEPPYTLDTPVQQYLSQSPAPKVSCL